MEQYRRLPLPNVFPNGDGAAVRAVAATWVTMLVYETKVVPDNAKLLTAGVAHGQAQALTQLRDIPIPITQVGPLSFGAGPFSAAPSAATPTADPLTTTTPMATDASSTISPLATASSPSSMDPFLSEPKSKLSDTTERILIIAGAVGAAIVVSFLIYMIYRFHRRRKRRQQNEAEESTPPPVVDAPAPRMSNWIHPELAPWQEPKSSLDASSSTRTLPLNQSSRSLPYQSPETIARPDTGGSNRPLVTATGLHSVSSLAHSNSTDSESGGDDAVSFVLLNNRRSITAPAPALAPLRSPITNISSPILPIEVPDQASEVDTATTVPAMPTFGRFARQSAPKTSRFSWTNSQAPKTPVDSRFSDLMNASTVSLPRYRTVESWVGQQTGHLSAAKIQEHLRQEIENNVRQQASSLDETKRDVRQTSAGKESSTPHPGTEVPMPRVSLIPSEILDSEYGHSGALENVIEER